MGKNKLVRWAEMKSFSNVIQPENTEIKDRFHPLRGNWKSTYFRNKNPLVLEMGCGKGEYTVGLALRYPERNHIGVDIKGARIWRGAKTAFEEKILNVVFIRTRIEFVNSFFAENEVDEVWITFPDPFPRARDEGRRLTGPHFLNLYRTFVRDKGTINLKTDNNQLYKYTLDTAVYNDLEIIIATDDLYSGNNDNEILSIRTHYENIFLREGKNINYLSFLLPKDKYIEYANKAK